MKKRLILFLIVSIVIINLAEASFVLNNYSIETKYNVNEVIKGWINISLLSEPGDNKISAGENFSGEISLIDFLNSNSASYDCVPEDCQATYSTSNSGTSKSFSLDYNEEKNYGFVLKGTNMHVVDFSFDVSVTNSLACSNPLEINLLNDNSIEWKSKAISDNFGCIIKEGTGCFNASDVENEVSIGETPFCEKISLTANEKFKLGAWIKKRVSRWYNGLLVMSLYDLDNNELVSCELPEPSPAGGEISCEIDFSNENVKDYYICVRAEEQTDYITKTESINSCGFYAYPGDETEYHDYYIFAKGARFSSIGNFIFNQEEYENQGNSGQLVEYLDNYLERFNRNCTDKCVIPVKFKAYLNNVDITISNLILSYSTGAGPSATPENKIYDTNIQSAKITSDYLKLDLSKSNITTPSEYGKYDLQIYLGDKKILNKEIEIIRIPIIKKIVPEIVPAAVPIEFIAFVESPSGSNITSYEWSFGDNETVSTNKNRVIHAYPNIGDYSLRLKVKDSKGFSAEKIFIIKAESPKESAGSTIAKYKNRLENLTIQFSSFPEWYKSLVNKKIDLDLMKDELANLEKDYESSSTSDEYVEIMRKLIELRIPGSVKTSSQGSLNFFVNDEDVNPSYFQDLGAGSYKEEENQEYREAIASWAEDVLDLNIKFNHISAYYEDEIENLISVFTLKINSKEEAPELYVVIEENDVLFREDYEVKEFSDATGLELDNIISKDLEFAVDYKDAKDLKLYLSPAFSQLEFGIIGVCDFDNECEKGENWRNCGSDCKPWGIAFSTIIIIILAALIAYIILQFWYKAKYESSLFKTKSDLFNIVNFIKNAENQGLNDSSIKTSLRNAGWTGEQIGYAFKKIRGKEIMPFDFVKLFRGFTRRKLGEEATRGIIPRF